jgi:ubiquinone/menaquinone biosynthesis C-methylase UbiE
MKTNAPFEGRIAWMTARVMAVQNRAAEIEAIEVLDPAPDARVAAIGCGAGVGVELLAANVACVLAVDPSPVMAAETRRRNRGAVLAGSVEVATTGADRIPCTDASLDGAVAVNSIQLWHPLETSLSEVARILRPGAKLVALTHDWAIERSTGLKVQAWLSMLEETALGVGLADLRSWRARAERGRSVAVVLTNTGGC